MCCPLSQVAVTLSDGTEYLCEVQINLKLMLAAKEKAHRPYEIVRKVCVRSIQHTAPNRAGAITHALPTTACPLGGRARRRSAMRAVVAAEGRSQ